MAQGRAERNIDPPRVPERRPCRLISLSLALACGLAAQAFDAAAGVCGEPALRARASPEPSVCARLAGSTAADLRALFAVADRSLHASRFDDAGRALDCVEAALDGESGWRARYELSRMRGNLLYHRERIDRALPYYECALELARDGGDPEAVAKTLNNIGTSWTRLGDYRKALLALRASRETSVATDSEITAATAINLGDLYRGIGDTENAFRHYEEAHRVYAARGDGEQMAHVRESMGTLALDLGDGVRAARWLEEALRGYRDAGSPPPSLLRTYAGLIEVSLAGNDLAGAQAWARTGLEFAETKAIPVPAVLQVQIARTELRAGEVERARTRLLLARNQLDEKAPERVEVLETLSSAQARAHDSEGALRSLSAAMERERELNEGRQSRQLDGLRFRVRRDHAVIMFEARDRMRTRLLWVVGTLAALTVLSVSAWFLRRQWVARLAEAALQARHEEELARYRRLADELRVDRKVLQASLDSRADAVCVLDPLGQVLAANAAMRDALAVSGERLIGENFADHLPDREREEFLQTLERLEDAGPQTFGLTSAAGGRLNAQLSEWRREEGVILLRLDPPRSPDATRASDEEGTEPPNADPPATQADATQAQAAAHADELALREDFRRALVELMLATVETWERCTGLNRLELAERSRIWRISIDDGRLRARTMDRYLALAKLPRNPHWRDVLRTAYFVLGQPELDEPARIALQARSDEALAYTRRSALV